MPEKDREDNTITGRSVLPILHFLNDKPHEFSSFNQIKLETGISWRVVRNAVQTLEDLILIERSSRYSIPRWKITVLGSTVVKGTKKMSNFKKGLWNDLMYVVRQEIIKI